MQRFIALAFISALSSVTSDAVYDCQYNTTQKTPDSNKIITETLHDTLSSLISSVRIWEPSDKYRQNTTVNIKIDGTKFSTSYAKIHHALVVEKFTCNVANNLEFTLKPYEKPLNYNGEIKISGRYAGYYNVTFNNVTISFTLNMSHPLDDAISSITPAINYQSLDIKFQSNAEDEALIEPFVSTLLQQIKTILKPNIQQNIRDKLDDSQGSLRNIVKRCKNPLHDARELPETAYYHVQQDSKYKNNSLLGIRIDVNSFIIEGLTHYKSITFHAILGDYSSLSKFAVNFENLIVYLDWQYHSENSTASRPQKTKFIFKNFTLRSDYQDYISNITTARFGPAIACQQATSTSLSSLARDILVRNMEFIIETSLYCKLIFWYQCY